MIPVNERKWTNDEHSTWAALFDRLNYCRKHQASEVFAEGVKLLGITGQSIPNLNEVNARLFKLTGWQGVFVEGLVDGREFLIDLANKRFPVGNFIRNKTDLNYTPAPDIFHDLYGHLPFLANEKYAYFCQNLGKLAKKYEANSQAIRMCERLFWFGVEFPLIETAKGRRIFGGGILSSYGESNYCLSAEPEVVPFDLKDIVYRDYNIDEMQKRLFLLRSAEQLYDCLGPLESLFSSES